jgi:hypothetical protein
MTDELNDENELNTIRGDRIAYIKPTEACSDTRTRGQALTALPSRTS